MQAPSDEHLRAALERFEIPGQLCGLEPLKRGHIHDTYISTWAESEAGTKRRFIHQRMNHEVFPDLELLMENIHQVTAHIHQRVLRQGGDGFEPLQLVHTKNGNPFASTPSGAWRTYHFIEDSASFDRCQGPEQAFEAARAFGWFQAQLQDLPTERLGETLPRFFSTPFRYEQFQTALLQAAPDRIASAREWIQFAQERAEMCPVFEDLLQSGAMPPRVVHGDTKLNNILFDTKTGKAKGIVDLDTCMAGYSLYDFGDLVRFTAATSAEDEADLDKIGTDLSLYQALAEGYRSATKGFLSAKEVELMPFAARLVTLTIGLRFLTDHLNGDKYFKTERPGHNLDRAMVQFGMVRFMEQHDAAMRCA